MDKEIRVRFAPSPTGYLHVGGLRTALYNFLFARKYKGKCILRIEDTDRTRLVENAAENLIKSLEWAGIIFDESPVVGGEFGPYVQSERLDIYQKYVRILLDNGSAYLAFDTSDEIDAMRKKQLESGLDPKYDRYRMRNSLTLNTDEVQNFKNENLPYVVRLLIPDKEIVFNDLIRGEIRVHGKEIDDQVLLKSDGFPTYHLANVVDDHLMEISHVIRGEEWLPSTPKHVILYNCFGWEMPKFAHLPLLLNPDKSKLSKRQGDVAVEDYIAKGYIKEAFINFIALLGWNPTADREIYRFDELIDLFNITKVNKAGAVFDTVKLDWMNSNYVHHILPGEELVEMLLPIMEKYNFDNEFLTMEYLLKVVNLFRERIGFVRELPETAGYMFAQPKEFDLDYKNKHWKENTLELISELKVNLNNIDDFSHSNLHDFVKGWIEGKGLKMKDIIHPVRLIVTGKSSGAGMFETMEVLGKERCLDRFDYYLTKEV